ncbi:MAG: hypothetical protein HKN74_05160 [Acidimicrobiia bacterium]|nr:hypothetical protein [Acidimicrobiia bacterium]NNF09656.1 hypothetical protein [Acidimicrobiia bacterium]
MTVEELLTTALHGADDYEPSPDLFARVRRSIDEDRAYRRRRRRALALTGGGVLAAAVWVAAFLDLSGRTARMEWWALEVLTVALMTVIVVTLGPVIRRFGRELTLEVFRSNQETSERFLRLLDIAYYLVFSAVIIMTTVFEADPAWQGRLASQLEDELVRVGVLLLLMGVLHAVTIAVLPVMGLLFASNWRRAARSALGDEAPPPDPAAERADRVATIIVWTVAGLLALQLAMIVLPALVGLIFGATG